MRKQRKPVSANALELILEKWMKDKLCGGSGKMTDSAKSTVSYTSDSAMVFDYKGVCDRLMDDTDMIKNVLKLYFIDTPPKVALIKKAILDNNCPEVELLSHAINGASANVGLERIRCIAAVIEQAGRAGDLSIVSGLIQELEKQFTVGEAQVQTDLSEKNF